MIEVYSGVEWSRVQFVDKDDYDEGHHKQVVMNANTFPPAYQLHRFVVG